MTGATGKILIVRGGAIGDFILTLPSLAALRQQFPGVRIELLGYPRIARLALAGQLVDHVESIEARAMAGFFARNGALDERLATYFSGFALILSYLYDPDLVFQQNVGRCSKAQFIAGPHRPDEEQSIPAAEVFLSPLQRLAIFEANPVPELDIPADTDSGDFNGTWLAVHPGSGSPRKNWPEARWGEMLRRLAETSVGLRFFLVGGEAEEGRIQRLAEGLPPERVLLAQALPLPELAARLRCCSAFVGHDSGIAHLAAAVGLQGLLLWGPSKVSVWRPPSTRIRLLESPDNLAALPVERVLSALGELFQ